MWSETWTASVYESAVNIADGVGVFIAGFFFVGSLFLGGGDKEGLVGITFEVVGPPGTPTLRVNPISAVAPGLLRKVFEFPSSVPGEHYEPRTSYADRDR